MEDFRIRIRTPIELAEERIAHLEQRLTNTETILARAIERELDLRTKCEANEAKLKDIEQMLLELAVTTTDTLKNLRAAIELARATMEGN